MNTLIGFVGEIFEPWFSGTFSGFFLVHFKWANVVPRFQTFITLRKSLTTSFLFIFWWNWSLFWFYEFYVWQQFLSEFRWELVQRFDSETIWTKKVWNWKLLFFKVWNLPRFDLLKKAEKFKRGKILIYSREVWNWLRCSEFWLDSLLLQQSSSIDLVWLSKASISWSKASNILTVYWWELANLLALHLALSNASSNKEYLEIIWSHKLDSSNISSLTISFLGSWNMKHSLLDFKSENSVNVVLKGS